MLPNIMLPESRIYPLSLPESKAMEEYIEEALVLSLGSSLCTLPPTTIMYIMSVPCSLSFYTIDFTGNVSLIRTLSLFWDMLFHSGE